MTQSAPIGKLLRTHTVPAASIQRAAIVAVVSFIFFLAMLLAFYIRMQIGYFMLSSAFLVVYLFTMIGLWFQRRNALRIFENGLSYRGRMVNWSDISSFERDGRGALTLNLSKGNGLTIPASIANLDDVEATIKAQMVLGG